MHARIHDVVIQIPTSNSMQVPRQLEVEEQNQRWMEKAVTHASMMWLLKRHGRSQIQCKCHVEDQKYVRNAYVRMRISKMHAEPEKRMARNTGGAHVSKR